MSFDTVNHYYSGQGVVLLAERDAAGNPKGFSPVGNVSDLKLTLAVSTVEHKESTSGQRATDLRLTTETKCSLSMTMENFIASSLADALRGEDTVVASGVVTDETITGYVGKITSLGHLKVSDVVIATTGGTPKTLTAYPGTGGKWDYQLNAEAGSFLLNPTAANYDKLLVTDFTNGKITLTVDYTYAAQVRVDALTTGAKELWMRFEGLNTAEDNSPVVIDVFRFLTDPMKELALISDTVQTFTLEGSMLADATKTSGSKFFTVKKLN